MSCDYDAALKGIYGEKIDQYNDVIHNKSIDMEEAKELEDVDEEDADEDEYDEYDEAY